MFNSIKFQISLFFFIARNLFTAFISVWFFILSSLKLTHTRQNVTFFGYSIKVISFLESFNLMYYYSMPYSIAIVFKKRLNLIFFFISCVLFILFFI